jgi:methylmalonyl-CoA/ethylmalonyl-CoA epimerase
MNRRTFLWAAGGAFVATAAYQTFLSSGSKAEAGDSGPSGLKGVGKMGVLRLHHVGVAVENVEEAARLYRDMFGCELSELREKGGLRAIFAYVGGDEVELLEDHRPDSLIGAFLQKHGQGIHHIGFEVEDIEAALQEAKARGLAAEGEKSRIGIHGVPIAFLNPESTRGVLIELCQKS